MKLSRLTKWTQTPWLLREILSQAIQTGSLHLIDTLGHRHVFGNGSLPKVTLRLKNPFLHHKLLINPSLYFGEAYMNGDFTIEEGTLKNLLTIFYKNNNAGPKHPWLKLIETFSSIRHRYQQLNSSRRSRRNASHHYDLSLQLYDLFLDPERQYSCAYFAQDSASLEEAQHAKMRYIADKLLIEPRHHVLDIGCGWGGLALSIARQTGAHVTGITLSREQMLAARKRAREEGLEKNVSFILADYRQILGRFDRIVSVGMFEHVGIPNYAIFFRQIRELLSNDGIALLHSIGRANGPSWTNPWTQKYIFPGGHIPTLSEVIPHVEAAGLCTTDIEILRLHYARTIRHWRERFTKNRKQARHLYDERFCRMWEFYLAGSEAAFEHLGMMVFQMQLALNPDAVPLTRDYLYDKKSAPISEFHGRKSEVPFDPFGQIWH